MSLRFMIEPCESVTFGPPKSASAGESHRIFSMFPPSPLTFQGMVRTRLLYGADPPLDLESGRDKDKEIIARLVGAPDALPPGWQLRGPFPARRLVGEKAGEPDIVQPWLPTPCFLLRSGPAVVHARQVVSTHRGLCDLDGRLDDVILFGRPGLEGAELLGGWIGPANLRYALAGEGCTGWNDCQWATERPPFVTTEFQPGLAVDSATASARHGMLYFNQALRFARGAGLYGHLDAPLDNRLREEALAQGAVQAGRKGRLAAFRAVARLDKDWAHVIEGKHLPSEVKEGDSFWLVAITPVQLDDPLQPTLPPAGGGVRVEIRAALTGRAISIGGYRLVDGKPRANRLYVPAGSAWLIEIRGGDQTTRVETLRALHDAHPLGPREEAAMGFGHTLVGRGPRTTKENP